MRIIRDRDERNRSALMRCLRRRDEEGQALVEFALVLPLIVLLMAVAFNGWNGIQLDLRLTSAARAGAIAAANDLAAGNGMALSDAVGAINAEESTTIYQTVPTKPDYVSMTTQTDTTGGTSPVSFSVVTITISNVQITLVPIAGNISVAVHATARYS
jgi:Flp pilus assembly protein TadG